MGGRLPMPSSRLLIRLNTPLFDNFRVFIDYNLEFLVLYWYASVEWKGGITVKSTGIVRRVDELGRVVLPIELRRTLNISDKDSLEIYVDGEKIILKKYEPACIFCGNAEGIETFRGKNVCQSCLKDLNTEAV
jgi:transcriptional pleiotropic regulator of transition state genes